LSRFKLKWLLHKQEPLIGINLANSCPISQGEVVGIIAAQSIGEPGTQLTMRTCSTWVVLHLQELAQKLLLKMMEFSSIAILCTVKTEDGH
jgi:hypothetical protein